MRSRRGWVMLDVLMGLVLIGIMAILLGSAKGWYDRSLRHLADDRAASRLAESALTTLQSGQTPSVDLPADSLGKPSLVFHEISSPPEVSGMSWVEVRATVHGRQASLIGLIPSGTVPQGRGG